MCIVAERKSLLCDVVPCCVLGMCPVDWDPMLTSVLLALVEATGGMLGLMKWLSVCLITCCGSRGVVVRAGQHRRDLLCCPWQLFARPL